MTTITFLSFKRNTFQLWRVTRKIWAFSRYQNLQKFENNKFQKFGQGSCYENLSFVQGKLHISFKKKFLLEDPLSVLCKNKHVQFFAFRSHHTCNNRFNVIKKAVYKSELNIVLLFWTAGYHCRKLLFRVQWHEKLCFVTQTLIKAPCREWRYEHVWKLSYSFLTSLEKTGSLELVHCLFYINMVINITFSSLAWKRFRCLFINESF